MNIFSSRVQRTSLLVSLVVISSLNWILFLFPFATPKDDLMLLTVPFVTIEDYHLGNEDNDSVLRRRLPAPPGEAPAVDETIRRWGCNREEYPYIFVHIGKAGGGEVRARTSVSAMGYNRSDWKVSRAEDDAYYPMKSLSDGGRPIKGRFCNSGARNFVPDLQAAQAPMNEGTKICGATTPIGKALACPYNNLKCCDNKDDLESCAGTVYVGHNALGSEMHWLPPKYLNEWWNNTYASHSRGKRILQKADETARTHLALDEISKGFQLLGSSAFCDNNPAPYGRGHRYDSSYKWCHKPKEAKYDGLSYDLFSNATDWADLYASLPVLRTTLVREPWSWLLSKFYWHRYDEMTSCDDIDMATSGSGNLQVPIQYLQGRNHSIGWATRSALSFILALCGEDCRSRLHLGQIKSLSELEVQAEGNLRRSFAVVGLFNESDTFYDMIDARVAYMVRTILT